MHNTYACDTQVVGNMCFSGSSYWSRNDWVLCSLLDTLWDMHGCHAHQQNIIPSGRHGSVRVDAVHQSRQRHPGGGLLWARHQSHTSRCISPSHRGFTVSSRSVNLLFQTNTLGLKDNCDHISEWVHWARACIGIAMRWVTLRKPLLAFLPPVRKMQFSLY
jgi:hypothetical protein